MNQGQWRNEEQEKPGRNESVFHRPILDAIRMSCALIQAQFIYNSW
jgi:hypothetical protein